MNVKKCEGLNNQQYGNFFYVLPYWQMFESFTSSIVQFTTYMYINHYQPVINTKLATVPPTYNNNCSNIIIHYVD